MADSKKNPPSFDEIIKAGRQKKQNERLAQEIFGNKRRSSTPGSIKKGGLGASLASRVGVTKRPSSLSRSQSSQSRVPQHQQRAQNQDQPARSAATKPTQTRPPQNDLDTQPLANGSRKSNNTGLSIKGAASGPFVVIASNFAVGTTAADIESVMASVGGDITYCKLVASSPTVIAEMGFRERSGADAVISTFNNKKADGRLLYVHMKDGSVSSSRPAVQQRQRAEADVVEDIPAADDMMVDVDENARSREAEDKLREERRGGGGGGRHTQDDRGRQEAFPSGPRRGFMAEDDYYYDNNSNRGSQHHGSGYQDGRYGFGGNFGGYPRRGGGWYDGGRGYGRGGGQWRG